MTNYNNMTMGELIDARKANNDLLDEANRVAKVYKDEENLIDAAIMIKLDSDQSTRAANATGSVSLTVSEEPNVDDWDKLYEHITATGDFALLHRRISATAYRELAKSGQIPPGLSGRTVRRINFRKA